MSTTWFLKDNIEGQESFPGGSMVKMHMPKQESQEMWIRFLDQEVPLEKEMQLTQVFLLGKSHGQKSLAGYSFGGCKESDMIEHASRIEGQENLNVN